VEEDEGEARCSSMWHLSKMPYDSRVCAQGGQRCEHLKVEQTLRRKCVEGK
jgi:hypothetical protein